jgi:hypothetical protein
MPRECLGVLDSPRRPQLTRDRTQLRESEEQRETVDRRQVRAAGLGAVPDRHAVEAVLGEQADRNPKDLSSGTALLPRGSRPFRQSPGGTNSLL